MYASSLITDLLHTKENNCTGLLSVKIDKWQYILLGQTTSIEAHQPMQIIYVNLKPKFFIIVFFPSNNTVWGWLHFVKTNFLLLIGILFQRFTDTGKTLNNSWRYSFSIRNLIGSSSHERLIFILETMRNFLNLNAYSYYSTVTEIYIPFNLLFRVRQSFRMCIFQ